MQYKSIIFEDVYHPNPKIFIPSVGDSEDVDRAARAACNAFDEGLHAHSKNNRDYNVNESINDEDQVDERHAITGEEPEVNEQKEGERENNEGTFGDMVVAVTW